MKKQSLSKNFIFQFLYQCLILVVPLILSPYLTRTLQDTALGIYSYTSSIAYYFVMLSNLGISKYGQRVIAQNSKNEISLRKSFWSLFTVHIFVSVFLTICYAIFVLFFVQHDKLIYLVQIFYVLSALFDITWLFYGLENFKNVVVKNALVRMAECALIFLCVKDSSDLWVYTLISSCGVLVGQAVMIPQAIRIIKPIRFKKSDAVQHIKPLLLFSISVIAVSLYTVFDKTLLGLMNTKENVAYYEYANKIISIPKSIVGVIGTVMLPRACKMASNGDGNSQKIYIRYSILLTAFISMGSIFGLLAIGKEFAIVYYGPQFSACGNVILALSPLIFIIGIGDVIRTQYMIPNHMDKHFNICILISAVINIIISVLLIPYLNIYGAVIGTIFAEIFGLIYQIIVCRKFIKINEVVKPSIPFALFGLMMFLELEIVASYTDMGLNGLLMKVLLGSGTYISFSAVYLLCNKKIDLKWHRFSKKE